MLLRQCLCPYSPWSRRAAVHQVSMWSDHHVTLQLYKSNHWSACEPSLWISPVDICVTQQQHHHLDNPSVMLTGKYMITYQQYINDNIVYFELYNYTVESVLIIHRHTHKYNVEMIEKHWEVNSCSRSSPQLQVPIRFLENSLNGRARLEISTVMEASTTPVGTSWCPEKAFTESSCRSPTRVWMRVRKRLSDSSVRCFISQTVTMTTGVSCHQKTQWVAV